MALPHHPEAVGVWRLGALVAGDHPRRHAHRPHQHHEAGGVVLAKTLAPVQPELVDRVTAVAAGLQGVDKIGLAHIGHQGAG